jgi:hypothetical protein
VHQQQVVFFQPSSNLIGSGLQLLLGLAGLVKGKHMSVDGSFIQANADHHSRVPPNNWRKWLR